MTYTKGVLVVLHLSVLLIGCFLPTVLMYMEHCNNAVTSAQNSNAKYGVRIEESTRDWHQNAVGCTVVGVDGVFSLA